MPLSSEDIQRSMPFAWYDGLYGLGKTRKESPPESDQAFCCPGGCLVKMLVGRYLAGKRDATFSWRALFRIPVDPFSDYVLNRAALACEVGSYSSVLVPVALIDVKLDPHNAFRRATSK